MHEAKLKAESEYEKFRVVQDKLFESDFDRFLKQLKGKPLNYAGKLNWLKSSEFPFDSPSEGITTWL
jgi:hypothetical protein